MEKNNLVRKNIRMSPGVAKWYESKSEELGVSQSNLMIMALNEYIKQDDAIRMMSGINELILKFEQLSEEIRLIKES